MSTNHHKDIIVTALNHYSQWMDAMALTSHDHEHRKVCVIEKYKADQALQEMENN